MEPCSVLVVEDDVDCAEVIAEALRTCGHDVAVAARAELLREHLERHRPDVLLVDGHLGAVDGIELVRELREGPLAGVPVLLTTGRARAEVARAARAAGIERILVKPLDLAVLFDAVRTAVERTRAARPRVACR
ncbi:response regulator [Vulgatibacter sp.]|uniref:response regulator n=1 Tax=Vulgatibacter sp. TaxID=1971226 RepID=UPI0035658BAA